MKDIINSYGGNPYGRLVEAAKLAQKDGVIKGIIFHQGETNTNNPDWKNKVADVVKNLKADLQLGDVPFLAGELLASTGACCSSHNVEVNMLPSLIPMHTLFHLLISWGKMLHILRPPLIESLESVMRKK